MGNVHPTGRSPLRGRHILFLGSSVTYGSAADGVSFADFIAMRCGCRVTKAAVSGTTLVDGAADSYVARLKRIDPSTPVDLFVCQLSTNDAAQDSPLGALSVDGNCDTGTVAGAIEWIIRYARGTWGCPIAFYTSPRFDSAAYAAMVDLLGEAAERWGVAVVDLWNDEGFNAITDEQRARYMADPIHPTRAGYLEWWTPRLEAALCELMGGEPAAPARKGGEP